MTVTWKAMILGVIIFALAFLMGTVFAPIGHDVDDETPKTGRVTLVSILYTAFLVWSIFFGMGVMALVVIVVPVICAALLWRWLWDG